ncbi:ABC transporter ATP-binding protein [Rhodoblastus sphagnicola]|uniref:ABC transporter ATP-binding protein n=1 Tax=Rhodoblastus sphagnicola TaxID=333368 RepID=A0A2S6N7D3_9HYPH|nr:AarF/ABC1/UbiB kinase family protein [Rhodoblastus sphagnicola]MBB4196916.1 putative unusual protein kinase regulating ubiquinone biosynthesis (AarF/ABC1/UbiB family) [Rhodoblastus sphagnicola]PPQ30523.1 ABC transporter ATP-binding protein [Rhodoblastus sphagnicola]
MTDDEANRFGARAARYVAVGAQAGGLAARMLSGRLFGGGRDADPQKLAAALGGLKGPLMKAAQFLATIPEILPDDYAEALAELQSEAPPMGAGFVARRMSAELGPDWRKRFKDFELKPTFAASLGQVHRATTLDGAAVACKLQYPDMASAVEADLAQLDFALSLQRRMDGAVDVRDAYAELAARLREELDYRREANNTKLYGVMFRDRADIRVPAVHDDLSTGRLLSMSWLEGEKLLAFKDTGDLAQRNAAARAIFMAWWLPFARFGVIHGDPHLGNYTVFRDGDATGINLLDYGCIRVFPPDVVGGVIQLYRGLRADDRDAIAGAYEAWGFRNLNADLIDALTVWARFLLGPLLEDRERAVADEVAVGSYGRGEAQEVRRRLRQFGPVRLPREFVFMHRAALGLSGAFLHLRARLNFHRLFEEALTDFSVESMAKRQQALLAQVGWTPSEAQG